MLRHGRVACEGVALEQEREVRASAYHPKDQLYPPKEVQEHLKNEKKYLKE